MKKIDPKYLHPLVRRRENVVPEKEMKYIKSHYARVIPPTSPQYSKMSPVASPNSPQYYRYETPTDALVENEKLPQPDRPSPSRPLL